MEIERIIRTVRDLGRVDQPKLLVIGAPRSGFALLIGILNHLLRRRKFRRDPLRRELQAYMPLASAEVYGAIENYFREHIDLKNLVVSDEFKLLVGGPKWLKRGSPDLACVRKYIGIRGKGDFLAVFSLPKIALDYYNVIHSHYEPPAWLQDRHYRDYIRFASLRNPLDVLNSSVFSINALTGEYIDRHVKNPVSSIREELALYKLTDLDFLEGLTTPLIAYLCSFVEVKEQYRTIRWEDLITEPEKTINMIGRQAGLQVSAATARQIWEEMKFKNQTAHHVHNFRQGIVGDWRNHLVNEHLEILCSLGFNRFLREFGYQEIEYQDPGNYTAFQRIVQDYLRKGAVYEAKVDLDLFTFAFNKSNFRSAKFDFVSLSGNDGVEVERSSIKDEELLRGFMKTTERALTGVRTRLDTICRDYCS